MKKEYVIALIASLVLALVVAAALWFLVIQPQQEDKKQLEKKVEAIEELAALEKEEMESDYERLGQQYGEMMTQITNDSLIAQLTREQMHVRQLEEELKRVKKDDLAEIARLRKELNTVRAVLRDYIRQVDSLNRENQSLRDENIQLNDRLDESTRRNQDLQHQRQQLTEKVTIAAQLDATAISMNALNKKGKTSKKLKDAKTLQVSFNIARNVTAENGQRTIYVRIQTPNGGVLTEGGKFAYENRQLEYSMKTSIQYGGEETPVTTYWQIGEFLDAGEYRVSIFADGNMIGSRTFSFEK